MAREFIYPIILLFEHKIYLTLKKLRVVITQGEMGFQYCLWTKIHHIFEATFKKSRIYIGEEVVLIEAIVINCHVNWQRKIYPLEFTSDLGTHRYSYKGPILDHLVICF